LKLILDKLCLDMI